MEMEHKHKHVGIKKRPDNSSSHPNSVIFLTDKKPKFHQIPSSSNNIIHNNNNNNTMLPADLPCTILMEILGRLPIKSLINCRYVCKSWRLLLSESYFYRLFSHHMCNSMIIQMKGSSLNILKQLYLTEFGDHKSDPKMGLMSKLSLVRTGTRNGSGSSKNDKVVDFRFQVGNSCNGLVCVRDLSSGDVMLVWNPMMGQFVAIPKPDRTRVVGKVVAGLGICGRTSRYKVVRIYHSNLDLTLGRKKQQQVEIYDFGVGDGKWREIGNAGFPIPSRIPGFYTHNSLHWILDVSSSSELICRFDFMEEKFKVVTPPPIYSENERNKYHWANLGIIGGCLSMSAIDAKIFRADVQVWVMEDYCVPESWIMRFSVRDPTVNWWDPHRWIQITNVGKDGEIVMLCAHSFLLVYSGRERRFTNMEELKFPAIAIAPSFISLEDVLQGTRSLNVSYL